MKRIILLSLFTFLFQQVIAQSEAPHKGIVTKSDTLFAEMLLPKKNNNNFQFYLYDSKMMQVAKSEISGKVGFAFDKTGSAILNPKLVFKDGLYETYLEDWKGFYYCLLKFNINGKEVEFRFLNPQSPKNTTPKQNSDGHSGHTH